MKRTGWNVAAAGVAAATGLTALVGATAAGAEDGDGADPAVVAAREAVAATPQPVGYQNPPAVQPDSAPMSTGPRPLLSMKDLYWLAAKQTTGGSIEVAGRDNPALDSPGPLTTTLRVYGNAAAFRSGAGAIGLKSEFTCTGSKVSSLSIGSSSVSVTGGATSSTLTWSSLRSDLATLRQYYTEGGHFRCKASNLTFAKFTRRATATANYKDTDTRAQDEYSFGW